MSTNIAIWMPPEGHRGGARSLCKVGGFAQVPFKSIDTCLDQYAAIINWGNGLGGRQTINDHLMFNRPRSVWRAAGKLGAFRTLQAAQVAVPPFTTDPEEALSWREEEKTIIIYCRHRNRGFRGQGIELVEISHSGISPRLPEALLYTKGMRYKHEYRVHCSPYKVFQLARKAAKRGVKADYRIRNTSTGWIFKIHDIERPPVVLEAGMNAVEALDLDFGAVDVGYSPTHDKAVVFEVNTRPRLVGTTLKQYAALFNAWGNL